MPSTMQTILKDRPFSNTLRIAKIEQFQTGRSGGAFKIWSTENVAFKLRVCKTPGQAKELEKDILRLKDVFPQFYGRDQQYLLLKLISGECLHWQFFVKHTSKSGEQKKQICFKIGQLQGMANKHICPGSPGEVDAIFHQRLNKLTQRHILSKSEQKTLTQTYHALRQKVAYAFCLDLRDSSFANYIHTESQVHFIDEEGLGQVKGIGIAQCLRQLSYSTEPQMQIYKKSLLQGYQSVQPDLWNGDYLLLVSLLDQINRIYDRTYKSGRNIDKDLDRLRGFRIQI
ncbi:MAG: hypothetical protein ACI8V2_002623 [Candidatus Latescibacterota bacterium]|jgi:hypothetical protein